MINNPHEDRSRKNKGIILINLGTPDYPTPKAVKKYLKEFLSDRRVIEINPILWKIILYGIILPFRSKKSAHAYDKIWDKKRQDSPLRLNLLDLTNEMQKSMGPSIKIIAAMRYGNPSIESAINEMIKDHIEEIYIFPLYPQYCGATTASTFDKVAEIAKKLRWQPNFKFIKPYYNHPFYIQTIANSIQQYLKLNLISIDTLICSFHGMPQRTLNLGDPYHCTSQKTARLIQEHLNWPKENYEISFQSRFGKAQWLSPSTDMILEKLAKAGKKNIAIFAPGFSMDCLETLEEIAIGYREDFIKKGGENLFYIPCLNSDITAVKLYMEILKDESLIK